MVTGFDFLRIHDPASEVAAIVLHYSGADGVAAVEVRKIGTERSCCCRSADGVAIHTHGAHENILAAHNCRVFRNRGGRLCLTRSPGTILIVILYNHQESHVRVLNATELGTLPAVCACLFSS